MNTGPNTPQSLTGKCMLLYRLYEIYIGGLGGRKHMIYSATFPKLFDFEDRDSNLRVKCLGMVFAVPF